MSSPLLFTKLNWHSDTQLSVKPLRADIDEKSIVFNLNYTDFTIRTTQEKVVLVKSRELIEEYVRILKGGKFSNILEFGTWEGGSPIFFASATNARKIVGIDIRDPSDIILSYAKRFSGRLQFIYNVSQDDNYRVNKIIDEHFEELLDLVIDDASHQYSLTRRAFEIAFSRLRVGGLYIIEDWNWAHYENRLYDELWSDQPALTNLALELTMAVGSQSAIRSLTITPYWIIVEKGLPTGEAVNLDQMIRLSDKRIYRHF